VAILDGFAHDRFLVEQLVRPIANLYKVTPLAAGEMPAGGPIAYVRQKKLAVKEDVRPIPYNVEILVDGRPVGGLDRKFQLRDRYVLDLSGDHERKLDRRAAIALAVGLDTLQNR
jgi:hypothetical protein